MGTALNCDICGRDIGGQAFKIQVEGAKMLVCHVCQKLGKPYEEETVSPPQPQQPQNPTRSLSVAHPPTLPRPGNRKIQLPKEMDQIDLVEDIALKVRKYRTKLGLSQEDLATRVKEKLSVIQKIETGKITPDIRLCRELEHELKVKLLAPRTETEDLPKGPPPSEVTLGDIIKIKDKTKTTTEQN
jgi:putative transcription factor